MPMNATQCIDFVSAIVQLCMPDLTLANSLYQESLSICKEA